MKKVLKLKKHNSLTFKFDLKMKLTTFLLIVSLFQIHANDSYGQKTKITLNIEKESIENVLNKIETLTEFKFLYNYQDVNYKQVISIKATKESVSSILNKMFTNSNVVYKVVDKQIVLKAGNKIGKTTAEKALITKQLKVEGTISDSNGQLLLGANILEKGTSNGTQSDFDGKFSLTLINENATLVVSYIGYDTKEVLVNNQTNLSISLVENAASLEEIIVVGYGTQKKKDLTGAIASISSEDLQNAAQTSVDQMLQGKVAGVRISQTGGQPGAGVSVRIRGNSSLNATNEPLYVIDGLPVSHRSGGTSNPLSAINPNDVESVQVLKDASSTAIYGARGANGVILITTKRGKSGKLRIDYNYSIGVQKIAKTLNILNGADYVEHIGTILGEEGESLLNDFSDPSISTDWQDQIFDTALMTEHNLSFSGGNEHSKTYLSLNYTDQEGIIKTSNFERLGSRFNWNYKKDRLSIDANINLSYIRERFARTGGANTSGGVIATSIYLPPTAPILNDDASYFSPAAVDLDNPYNILQGIDDTAKRHRTMAKFKLGYELFDGFEASVAAYTDVRNNKFDFYRSRQTITGAAVEGMGSITSNKNEDYTLEGLLNYKHSFNENHNISAMVGYTFQKFMFESSYAYAEGFPADELNAYNLGSGAQDKFDVGSSKSSSQLLSYLTRLNYNYKNKVLATASLRYDGTSVFADGNKFASFPSFSIGYRISEEDFMQPVDFISDLKLRLGWGQIGNTGGVGFGNVTPIYVTTGLNAVFDEKLVTGLVPSSKINPDLKWESTEQINIGLDFSFFNNRIGGSVDFYKKTTNDLLFNLPIPLQTGFSTQRVNLLNSEIVNKGFEVTLNTVNVKTNNFVWDSNFNLTVNDNVIEKLDGNRIISSSSLASSVANIEGEAPFSYYGYEAIGVWQEGEDPSGSAQPDALPGQPKWKNQNGDDVIDDKDRTVLGNPYADFGWGLTNTFKFKNLELSVLLEGSHGGELFNNLLANTYFPFNTSRNRLAEPIVNRWTSDNPTNAWPSFVKPSAYGGDVTNSYTITDASFVRLKNITLRYAFNLKDSSPISNASIFVSGQNLHTWSDYIGYDPDLSGGGNIREDFNSFPTSRTFTVGLNLGF
ncbi:SusC/RagA family TonB-linked outer membrane protein [Cellulophaga fucicola]|uniref:SusC/RagA family TonB-linked outer membrane protein n=1 Tax=Cellulophaga fucicola TaxID=76595 RepID=UPI003EBB5012